MSTTNIDEQKMQQINSSDTITQFMEKCNNNFSNIFRYRSGPEGKQGVEGSQGVPTKPKVPIHVWKKDEQDYNETNNSEGEGFVLEYNKDELKNDKYQDGHLILLENAHVYRLDVVDNSLKPKYILTIQSYDPSSVIDGKTAYVHIAFANSSNGKENFTLSENLNSNDDDEKYYTHMGIYSDCTEKPFTEPEVYTWVRIVGDQGEKGEKGEKGDTQTPPTSTNVEVVGYSLSDLDLKNENWEKSISDLGELKPGTPIYIKNKYTWSDGTVTYGKTVTIAGTQGIKGETGRVLFYLGSYKDGTLDSTITITGLLNDTRCDYYIDGNEQAWMRIGTESEAVGYYDGEKWNNKLCWKKSEKVGFLQAGAISADMINVDSLCGNNAFITNIKAIDISAERITSGKISSKDGKSYFNLDDGGFVLGNDNKGGGALSYIDGKLHIGGLPNIGGRNLLEKTSFHYEYKVDYMVGFTTLYNLDEGKKYIATYGKFEDNADVDNEWARGVCLVVSQSPSTKSIEQVVKFGEPFEVNGNGRYLYIAWGIYEYVNSVKGSTSNEYTSNNFIQYLEQVMLQEGEVATAFQPSIDEELVEIEQAQENFQNSLNNINSDEYFSMVEKKNIRTDWETISGAARTTATIETYSSLNGNYGEAYRAAESSSIVTTDIDTAFISLRDYLNTHELYEDTDTSWGNTGRKTLAEKFTAYYNAESALWNAINNAYVDSKVFDDTAYSYLKKALANDTDIEGGLIATSQIQLRDWTGEYLDDGKTQKEYKVNAGISGIEDDNVLLWGGGTYSDAVNAANNDSYDTGNGAITTLLKKDGTGKIGVFHIEEDQVQVKTNDGTVVIDDMDGLSCKIQSQEHAAVLVTPKELKTFDELKELGDKVDDDTPNPYVNPFESTLVKTMYGSENTYVYSNEKSYEVYVGSGGTITITGQATIKSYTSDSKNVTIGDQDNDGIYCVIKNSGGTVVASGLASETGRSSVIYTAPTAGTYTVIVKARIAIQLTWGNQDDPAKGVIVKITLDEKYTRFNINRKFQLAEQQTMVAYKGIFSYQGEDAYFYYKDGVGLDCQIGNIRFSVNDKGILINGLQEGSSGLTKGMLYSSNGTLKIVQ